MLADRRAGCSDDVFLPGRACPPSPEARKWTLQRCHCLRVLRTCIVSSRELSKVITPSLTRPNVKGLVFSTTVLRSSSTFIYCLTPPLWWFPPDLVTAEPWQ